MADSHPIIVWTAFLSLVALVIAIACWFNLTFPKKPQLAVVEVKMSLASRLFWGFFQLAIMAPPILWISWHVDDRGAPAGVWAIVVFMSRIAAIYLTHFLIWLTSVVMWLITVARERVAEAYWRRRIARGSIGRDRYSSRVAN